MKKNILISVLVISAVAGWIWVRSFSVSNTEIVVTDINSIVDKRDENTKNTHKNHSSLPVDSVIRAKHPLPETVAETNDISAENISGVIPDEYILSFYSEDDRNKFIELAKSMGAEILDTIKLGNSIRLRADADTLRKLKAKAPMSVDFARNREMSNPPLPILDPEAPEGTYNMFGGGVLAWMGVGDNADWGKGVKIAVLDSGINDHPSLKNSSISLLDMLGGSGRDPSKDTAHGTSVASLIAGNNEFMRGVAPASEILGIRVANEDGKGDLFSVAHGIVAAVDAGVDIINLSMGSRSDSFLLRDAVKYAAEHGVVIVASTGNDASYGISFPAGYDSVVAVPAVDAAGRHLYFSNRGDEADIAAPGLGINAAGAGDTMDIFSGTSAATPLISGAIAAIMSEDPALTPADALQILMYYSDDAGKPGPDDELGAGIVDMRRVMERDEEGIYDIAVNAPYLTSIEAGGDVKLVVSLQNRGTEDISSVELRVNIDGARYSVFFNDIPVARTVSDSFRIPASSLQVAGNLDVEAEAVMIGHSDTYPNNNYMRINVYYSASLANPSRP